MSRRRAAVLGVVAAIAVVAAAAVWSREPGERSPGAILAEFGIGSDDETVQLPGTLEGESATIGALLGGAVVRVAVEPGDAVMEGEVLVELSDPVLEARLRQAEAALDAAEASRRRAVAGATELQRRLAAADLAKAEAEADGKRRAWQSAADARRAAVGPAAGAAARTADKAARTAYEVAQALNDAAEARLRLLEAGPSEADLAVADATVRRAEAAVRAIRLQLDALTVRAPGGATVDQVVASPGENVLPATPLVRLVRLDPLFLTVYVSEDDLATVQVGSTVRVTPDAWESSDLDGRVSAIASEPEFDPRATGGAEDHSDFVYAVTIHVPNPDGDLSPGMAADATWDRDAG